MPPVGVRRELDAEEWAILAVLAQSEDRPRGRTALNIAATLQSDPNQVMGALAKLEREGLALSICGPSGEVTWMSTSPDAR